MSNIHSALSSVFGLYQLLREISDFLAAKCSNVLYLVSVWLSAVWWWAGFVFFNWKQLGAVAKNNAMRAVWFNQNSYGLKNYNELKDNKKVLAGHAGI